ncbi:hypothetical protein M3Y95_00313500 [Aphelenchoides besseyi]|nr:hypothetical protein M3Y95_00313500 [Aphelenchoides besseyi]
MYENVPETPTLSPETERAAHRMIIDLWDQRENRTELSKADVFEYNKLMTTFVPTRGYLMTFCGNKTKTIPSSYNFDSELIHAACNEKGTGRKNIVVFGNSHAVFAHAGIAHVFRDLYSELTTVFQFSCVPLPGNQQQERLTTLKTGKQKCVKLMEEFVKALRQWTKPIDILIILFGYNGMDDPLINKNLEAKDEGFLWMQRFYGELHSMVREVMILPQLNPFFSFLPVRLVQTKLSQNESTESVGDPRSKMKRVMPNARRHLQMIRCDRCLRVDFLTLWCTKIDDLCRVVDENGLLYFVDDHHQSLYGSLRAANYLRSLYENYTSNKVT